MKIFVHYCRKNIEKNFIIGGSSIYNYAIESLDVCDIYATEIYQTDVEYDTFFPKINYSETNTQFKLQNCGKFEREKVERGEFLYYRFMRYRHQKYMIEVPSDMIYQNKAEKAYLAIMKHTLENGIEREDRTGTGTISTFGNQLKYDLSETFPLSTTKRMFFRAIFE